MSVHVHACEIVCSSGEIELTINLTSFSWMINFVVVINKHHHNMGMSLC